MKKMFIIVLVVLLFGCSQSTTEKLLECMEIKCEATEKSEAVIDYIDVLSVDYDIRTYLDNFSPFGVLFHAETSAQIGLIYSNEVLSYAESFDYMDDIYNIFLLIEPNLLNLDTEKDLTITSMIFIEEGFNDYSILFQYSEATDLRILSIDMDGFEDEYDVFMNTIYEELSEIITYREQEFDIKIDLATDAGYIHIYIPYNVEEIQLDFNGGASDEVNIERLNSIIESLEASLGEGYTLVLED